MLIDPALLLVQFMRQAAQFAVKPSRRAYLARLPVAQQQRAGSTSCQLTRQISTAALSKSPASSALRSCGLSAARRSSRLSTAGQRLFASRRGEARSRLEVTPSKVELAVMVGEAAAPRRRACQPPAMQSVVRRCRDAPAVRRGSVFIAISPSECSTCLPPERRLIQLSLSNRAGTSNSSPPTRVDHLKPP